MPRTETVSREIYQFTELPDTAKEHARNWWRECENESFSDTVDYDDFQECARRLGIEIDTRAVPLMNGKTRSEPCIYWSGFSSQGDGARFEGRYSYAKGSPRLIREHAPQDTELHRIADALAKLQARHFYSLAARCKQGAGSNFYSHSGTMAVECWDARDEYRSIGDADNELRQLMRDFADWMYRQLEAEYEYRMSDEQVDDAITANEYEFTESGERA